MTTPARPPQVFPQRVPLKVIGRGDEMDPAAMARLIEAHLGPQPEGDRAHTLHRKGPFVSYTFWVTLPGESSELPLRTALAALPGVVMQL